MDASNSDGLRNEVNDSYVGSGSDAREPLTFQENPSLFSQIENYYTRLRCALRLPKSGSMKSC